MIQGASRASQCRPNNRLAETPLPALPLPVCCPALPLCSYYFLVSLSVLPPSAYQPLLAHATQPAALRAWPQLPRLGWVLGQVSALQLAGAGAFLLGNALQCHSHWLLARLAGKGHTLRYRIPRGDRR